MSLFNKNPNEVNYVGGKKHWTDVIKNSGPGELLIWRQPEEDFNTNSTLIVMPGEEAIFIKDGIVVQTFENGKYELSTENYPFISRLRNAFSGGISTFNCVVYFVRKAHSEEILWGTESPIQVRDNVLGVTTKLRGRGAYKVQIENPAKFLEKLIGNNVLFQTQSELNKYFYNEFQSKIRSAIAKTLMESKTEILGIDARLDELSNDIQPAMQEILDDYGLKCIKFTVSALDIEDNEQRQKYDTAYADKGVMGVLGDDWGRQQAVDVMKSMAENPSGGAAAAGAGIGMGFGAAGAFGAMSQQVFAQPINQNQPANEDPIETLSKLKKMLDAGLIEQAEYDAKKAEILSRM